MCVRGTCGYIYEVHVGMQDKVHLGMRVEVQVGLGWEVHICERYVVCL